MNEFLSRNSKKGWILNVNTFQSNLTNVKINVGVWGYFLSAT